MTTTPEAITMPDLTTYTAAALVDAVIQLTHRIHGLTDQASEYSHGPLLAEYQDQANDLRAQRDLARAELIRRAGE